MNFRNVLAFAIGPIGGAAFGLVTVPIVAWAFSPEDVGRLNILHVTLSFCLLFTVLGLDQAYVREFHGSPDHPRLLKATFTPGFLLLVLGAAVAAFFSEQISMLLYGMADPKFFWITLASAVMAFVARFLSLILRMQERGLAFSMSQLIPKGLFLILLFGIIAFKLERTFATLLSAFFVSTMTVVAVYIWNTRTQWWPAIKVKLDGTEMRGLLRFGIPLIFSGTAYWGLVATSTISLRSFSSFSELGIYSVTTSIAGVAAIFQSIFTVVWAPIVYKWVADGVDASQIDRVARQALAVVCLIFVMCGVFSWLLDYLLPEHYSAVKYLLLCAIVQPLFYTLSEITCVGISISRRTRLAIWVTFAALCTNVLLCLFLVPLYGAAGALVANAVAFWVFLVARTEASASVWRQFPRSRMYVFTTISVMLAASNAFLTNILPFNLSFLWLAITPLVLWYFLPELRELTSIVCNGLNQQVRHCSKVST